MLRFLFMLVVTAITATPFAPFAPFAPFMPFVSLTDSKWTVLDVTAFADPLKHEIYDLSYVLSSDGSMLAWMATINKLCMTSLPSKVTLCRAMPEDYAELTVMAWSPNNQYLLLNNGVGEFSSRHYYAPKTGEFGSIEQFDSFSSPLIWDPSDAAAVVYYLTYIYEGAVDFSLLHRYSIATEKNAIIDLEGIFDTPLNFWSVVPISTDGTQFVFQLQYSNSPAIAPGLWRVDIAAARADLLVTLDELGVGLPSEGLTAYNNTLNMVWDQARNRLLLAHKLADAQQTTFTLTSIDLESGAVLPLLTTEDAFRLTGGPSFTEGYITPDGEFFFYMVAADPLHPAQKTVFALPLAGSATTESQNHEPIMVMQDYSLSCPRTALLVTLGRDDLTRNYLYEPHIICR